MPTSRSFVSFAFITAITTQVAWAQIDSEQPIAGASEPTQSTFIWDRFKTTINPSTRVTFTNGVLLAGSNGTSNQKTDAPAEKKDNGKNKVKDKDKENQANAQPKEKATDPNKKIVAFNPKLKRAETVAENDVVYIAAAYPSLSKAKVAVVGQSCTQSECRPQDTKLIVMEGDFIKTYSIDDAKKLEITLQDNNELSAKAEGISMGNDNYGAEIREALTFKTGLGFVSNALTSKFQELVGKHPEQFLSDPNIRDVLLNKMGNDAFLQFREKMKVASGARLVKGKFLVLQGCQAHACADNLAVLLIDGTTGDMWWCSSEAGQLLGNNGSTLPAKLRRLRTSELHALAPNIDLDHEYLTIDVSYDGFLQILER